MSVSFSRTPAWPLPQEIDDRRGERGDTIRLTARDQIPIHDDGLIDGARRAAREAAQEFVKPPRLLLVFSCASRIPLLGERLGDEIAAICSGLEDVSVCGFYTYGEFARTTGSSGVHNSSVAILAL